MTTVLVALKDSPVLGKAGDGEPLSPSRPTVGVGTLR